MFPCYQLLTAPCPLLFPRLAAKTTDINWTKAKDLGDHMGYYNNRSCPIILQPHLTTTCRQFKWFNPSNLDYSTISDKRNAPNYRD